MPETLAAGDLTTAFVKWLATIEPKKNEAILARLNTNYGTTTKDVARPVTKFLHDRA